MTIRDLRIRAGYSQKEVAKKLHIGQNSLSQYETGKRQISPEIAKDLAAFFGVTLNEIYGYSAPAAKSPAAQGDGAWERIKADPAKRAVVNQIAHMGDDDLKRLIALLEAARLLPDE